MLLARYVMAYNLHNTYKWLKIYFFWDEDAL